MKTIETPHAPQPVGHYSQAVVHGGFVFVSGQLPHDPAHPGVAPGDVEKQTERALRNVEAILEAAGSGLDRLVSVTVFVREVGLWARVNAAYARVLGPHRPARAIIPVGELRHGYLVEVHAVAAVRD